MLRFYLLKLLQKNVHLLLQKKACCYYTVIILVINVLLVKYNHFNTFFNSRDKSEGAKLYSQTDL